MHRVLTPDAFDSLQSVLGVNGALDFGPLAGDQPGGEGTGKVCTLELTPRLSLRNVE